VLTKRTLETGDFFNPLVALLRNNTSIQHTIWNIIKIADIPLSCLAIFLVGSSQCWNKTDTKVNDFKHF